MSFASTLLGEAGRAVADGRWKAGVIYAADRKGNPIDPASHRARAWDAFGLVYAAARVKMDSLETFSVGKALAYLDREARRLFGKSLAAVNDEEGIAALLEVFRAAWKSARYDELQREPEKVAE